ncbi:MAG: hypothetical protein ACRDLB_05675, partial [Actinomycetota bacterium]
MTISDLATDLVRDLLRSAWIIERARANVYERWARADAAYGASMERSIGRSRIVAQALKEQGRAGDEALVRPHAEWIVGLIGKTPT